MLPKNMKIVGTFDPQYVLEQFVEGDRQTKKRSIPVETEYGTFEVYTNSQRYVLFKEKGLTCIACGVTCERVYLIQSDQNPERAHFDFIVDKDGEEWLLTKDHTKAKANGGRNVQSNYQPMCEICNREKGHS